MVKMFIEDAKRSRAAQKGVVPKPHGSQPGSALRAQGFTQKGEGLMSKSKDTEPDFEITGGIPTTASTIAFAAVGPLAGKPTQRYMATNTKTGEKHKVLAESKPEASRKAHEGKFEK
jgi:hypothetical protein